MFKLIALTVCLTACVFAQTEEVVVIGTIDAQGSVEMTYPSQDLADALEQGLRSETDDGDITVSSDFTIEKAGPKYWLHGTAVAGDGSNVGFVVRLYEAEPQDGGDNVICVREGEYELVSCTGVCSPSGCRPTTDQAGNANCACPPEDSGTCNGKWEQKTTFWGGLWGAIKTLAPVAGTIIAAVILAQ